MSYIPQLLTVPADSTIYDVYALDKPLPLGGVETLIGSLKMEGNTAFRVAMMLSSGINY